MALEQHTGHDRRGAHPAAHDGHEGHGGHAGNGDHAARFRDRFWWSLALTFPVVAYSEMVQEWLGFTPPWPGSAAWSPRPRPPVPAPRPWPTVRPESHQAVDELHRLGKRVVMLTGDARQVAEAVAADLGVDEVLAEVLPEDKDAAVAGLQGRGLRVAMVGDGVNDAPALARADVGIAIGAGTDVAIESAGIVLAANDPRGVLGVLRLSQASYTKMLQNLGWATGYNLLAVPLAAGVLAWAGVTLAPAVGAVLMSASTIVVALNAQLLRRLDLRPART
jgi:soluble P-type ATPase